MNSWRLVAQAFDGALMGLLKRRMAEREALEKQDDAGASPGALNEHVPPSVVKVLGDASPPMLSEERSLLWDLARVVEAGLFRCDSCGSTLRSFRVAATTAATPECTSTAFKPKTSSSAQEASLMANAAATRIRERVSSRYPEQG